MAKVIRTTTVTCADAAEFETFLAYMAKQPTDTGTRVEDAGSLTFTLTEWDETYDCTSDVMEKRG